MSTKENPVQSQERLKSPGTLKARFNSTGFTTYDRVLFEDLNLNITSREVTAISGKSGAGKTVILKILAGLEAPEEGSVDIFAQDISYVPQELEDLDIDPNTSIYNIFKQARRLDVLEEKLQQYEQQLADDPSCYASIADDYGNVMELFTELGGYNPEPEMMQVLAGLGVDEHSTGNITLDTRLNEVSSGQLRRIMIARALFSQADLLILDDPTSHLDVASVDWLSDYLKSIKSAVVLASNNRTFLDKCATQTMGLTDSGRVFVQSGGFSAFERKRDAIIEAEQLEAGVVSDKLDQLKETDRKFREKNAYKRSSDMAQVGRALGSRIRRLETQYDNMPGSKAIFGNLNVKGLAFQKERRSGDEVVKIIKPVKKYGEYKALDLERAQPIIIQQGEKWLIWGPNGSGKSTLVRMIASEAMEGNFSADNGNVSIGASVDTQYFAPDYVPVSREGLLIDEVTSHNSKVTKGYAVSVLSFFGFNTNAIFQQDVSTLSAGEKKRLVMAQIMLRKPNLIILDEPTGDYLSEEISDRLASAINQFDGTLILVSHDRSFIDKLGIHRILDMPSGKIRIV